MEQEPKIISKLDECRQTDIPTKVDLFKHFKSPVIEGSLLTEKEKELLAQLLNEKVADLSLEYDNTIPHIQKKLRLYPRKERWVLCGILYVAVIEHAGATMRWLGPIVRCDEKVERPYSDANLRKQGKLK